MRTVGTRRLSTGVVRWKPAAALFVFVCCFLPADFTVKAVLADGFVVREAHTDLVEEVYQLDAQIDYKLSDTVLDALENGVPITIEIRIEVYRPREYLWKEEIASLRQRYRLEYHALSQQYLVTNLNTRAQQGYPSRSAAIEAVGTITDLPMLDRRLLKRDENYKARLRASLDIEALPAPLRLLAYLSSDWRVSSKWYTWEL